MKLIIDSCARVELFLGGKIAERVSKMIEDADEARTPDVVLAEIARKYFREKQTEIRPLDTDVCESLLAVFVTASHFYP